MSVVPVQSFDDALPIQFYSMEAEQAILGGLMIDNQAFKKIEGKLVPEDFHQKNHQIIFRAIIRQNSDGNPADVVTLSEFLNTQYRKASNQNILEEVGGLSYLGLLARDTPAAANIRAYVDIVRNYSIKRQLLEASNKIREELFSPEGRSIDEMIADAEALVAEVSKDNTKSRSGFTGSNELLGIAVDLIDQRFNSDSLLTGVPTGWQRFDDITHGLQPGDLIIVAARPSVGKTAFAMNIAQRISVAGSKPAAVFSMEQPKEQLIIRMLAAESKINHDKLRSGNLEDADWALMTSAIAKVNGKPLFINDDSALRPSELSALARQLEREHGQLGVIVVDYIQLMVSDVKNKDRTDLEIASITGALKRLAKELKVPVVALSQLNRNLEQRKDKRPVMADLRESGAIEQDADVICFIYRDQVYHKDSIDENGAEIIIGKNRNGETGVLPYTFLGQYQRFEETDLPFLPSWKQSNNGGGFDNGI